MDSHVYAVIGFSVAAATGLMMVIVLTIVMETVGALFKLV